MDYYHDSTSGLYVILGTLPVSMTAGKNIAYFAFNRFRFDPSNNEPHESLINQFHALVTNKDIDGIIIDARGKGGGNEENLQQLWKVFTNSEDIQVSNTRRKGGDERQNYLKYMPYYIKGSDSTYEFDKNIPIAYLINESSVSCAELSALFFKALKDYHGYNTAIIGERSNGGFGMLLQGVSEEYYNSGCTSIDPYIRQIYTPYLQTEYLNGENYEGVGVPVDGDPVYFDYDSLTQGTDTKLKAAITWVNSNAGGK